MSIKQAIEAMDRTNHEMDSLAYASSEDYIAIRKAAPEMADWITKALPYLKSHLDVAVCEGGPAQEDDLRALIAEATE